jgi:hypothetical protein
MTCRNCLAFENTTTSGLCTLCYLAVAGASLAEQTEEQALSMIRQIRVDKRMQQVNQVFEAAARNVGAGG